MTAPAPIISAPYQRPALELADILRAYLPAFLKEHTLPVHHHKVLRAIMNCRTAALDIHAAVCDTCGTVEYSYNSCRDRHCPKCQGSAKLKWLGQRVEELLPTSYYHCVFTLPHLLNLLLRYNQKQLYDLLFHAAFATLNSFAANPKWLGASLGFIGILHTWGQDLKYHVHLHFIVTSGGLSEDGTKWIAPKYEHDFLFPVRAMSKVFRGKFIAGLSQLLAEDALELPGEMAQLRHPVPFEAYKRRLHDEEWVVYAKPPFGGPADVLSYIGRYTHRVAISNHRLKGMEDGAVTFEYKDYKDKSAIKTMTLSGDSFISRFLQHVAPTRYVRIRYGGLLAGRERSDNLRCAHTLLATRNSDAKGFLEHLMNLAKRLFEAARRKCPSCGEGTMLYFELLHWVPSTHCWRGEQLGPVFRGVG
ncbi:MAG: IS91 family transposase [Desulfobacteraceae bacterium]|nr:IS91 family transposase [Desulfobacteraceae bacterium]